MDVKTKDKMMLRFIISKHNLFLNLIIIILLSSTLVYSRTHTGPPDDTVDFLIEDWDRLPFKHQRANKTWVEFVNENLEPQHDPWRTTGYDINDEKTSSKCLSYAASTTSDWFKLVTSATLGSYQNFVNNRTENGTNPRELEAIYHDKPNYKWIYRYALLLTDGVTREQIPYNIEGYADILTDPPTDWLNEPDPEISSFKYNLTLDEYLDGYNYLGVGTYGPNAEAHLRDALEKYGMLYIHADLPYTNLALHALTLIGYNITPSPVNPNVNITEFWYHDSYDGADYSDYSRYGTIRIYEINKIWAFYDTHWPFAHHDLRRTGFTLLKGDMSNADDVRDINLTVLSGVTEDHVSRPSIADLDGNGKMEVVTSTYQRIGGDEGYLFAVEASGQTSTTEKWKFNATSAIEGAPSLVDIDGDGLKEVIFATRDNGTVRALDINSAGNSASEKWSYQVEKKYSAAIDEWIRGRLAHTAVADIDLDSGWDL